MHKTYLLLSVLHGKQLGAVGAGMVQALDVIISAHAQKSREER